MNNKKYKNKIIPINNHLEQYDNLFNEFEELKADFSKLKNKIDQLNEKFSNFVDKLDNESKLINNYSNETNDELSNDNISNDNISNYHISDEESNESNDLEDENYYGSEEYKFNDSDSESEPDIRCKNMDPALAKMLGFPVDESLYQSNWIPPKFSGLANSDKILDLNKNNKK